MKKNYKEPEMKVYEAQEVMAIDQTSSGYEQGVSGEEGTDDEARTPLF